MRNLRETGYDLLVVVIERAYFMEFTACANGVLGITVGSLSYPRLVSSDPGLSR